VKKIAGYLVVLLFCESVLFAKYDLGESQNYTPVWSNVQAGRMFPKSKPPTDTIYLFDVRDMDYNDMALATTTQGLINRQRAQVYVGSSEEKWLNWLVSEKYIKNPAKINSLNELLAKLKTKKVVLIDSQMPGLFNIATMVAGVEGMPVAYPEHIEKYGLEIGIDLRSKFKTNIEAYQWVFDNYWPRMNHQVLAWISPEKRFWHLRDYLVEQKIFTMWITGRVDGSIPSANPKEEEQFFRLLLSKMPVNMPVLGFPWAGDGVGIGEQEGVAIIGSSGKFLTCCDYKSNLSFWTGLKGKRQTYKQKPMRDIKLENDKMYITLVMSDGDNLNTFAGYFCPFWEDKTHGQIPLGWTMGPALLDLQAPLVDYYYDGLPSSQNFGCAVSGIGYILPETYGYDFKPEYRQRVWNQYIRLTSDYMKRLDMTWVHIFRDKTPIEQIPYKQFAAMSAVKSVFSDYGRRVPYDKTLYYVDGKLICHSLSNQQIDKITELPKPAFVHIFLYNWDFNGYDKLKSLTDRLPKDAVIVRPDELTNLYQQYVKNKK
jgi:hypothetical protein